MEQLTKSAEAAASATGDISQPATAIRKTLQIEDLAQRYRLPEDDLKFDQLFEHVPTPILGGITTPVEQAAQFKATAQTLMLMDGQRRRLLRVLLSAAYVHCLRSHGDSKAIMARMTSLEPWANLPTTTICITGLSEGGKSTLIKRFLEVMNQNPGTMEIPGLTPITSQTAWRASFEEITSASAALRQFDPAYFNALSGRLGPAAIIPSVKKLAYTRGTCLQFLDELQFVAASAGASTLVSKLLLLFAEIGPQSVFTGNFSLIHKLFRRPQEERNRLLSRPFVLRPYRAGSKEWIRYLKHSQALAPEFFSFDVEQAQDVIHQWTFGLPGNDVELRMIAIAAVKSERNTSAVDLSAMKKAYCSMEYIARRKAVETLFNQNTQRKEIESDLWCPFQEAGVDEFDPLSTGATQSSNMEDSNARVVESLELAKRRVAEAALQSAMTNSERKGLAGNDSVGTLDVTPKKSRLRLPPVSEQDLLQAAKSAPRTDK